MRRIQFLDFELDLDLLTLTKANRLVPIGRRVLDLLICLIENRHQFVSQEILREKVWGGASLSAAAIPTGISGLRKLLGDEAEQPRIIESKRGFGYRFSANCVFSRPLPGDLYNAIDEVPFVGRKEELGVLRAALRSVSVRRRMRCVLVRGEAGIGKSRLVNEFLTEVSTSVRRNVVRCHSLETESVMPWQSLLDQGILEDGSEVSGESFFAAQAEVIGAAERLRAGGVERSAYYSAWAKLFDCVVGGSPIILVLEDIHSANVETVNVLSWIVEYLSDSPALILATQRPRSSSEEVDQRLSEFAGFADVAVIDVQPLDASDIKQIVDCQLAASDVDFDEILGSTGGNPLLLSHAVRAKQVRSSMGDAASSGREYSRNVDLVARVASDLSVETRALLSVGAILAQPLSSDLAARVAGIDWHVAAGCLEEARRARLMTEDGCKYDFAHPILRAAFEGILGQMERRRLHEQVARVLGEQTGRSGLETTVAYHLISAGPLVDPAVVQRSAELAIAVTLEKCSFLDAKFFAEKALGISCESSVGGLEKRCELMIALARCNRSLGARSAARALLLDAYRLASSARLHSSQIACAVAMSEDFLTIDVGVHDVVVERILRESLRVCPVEDVVLRAILTGRLSLALRWSDNPGEQSELANESYRIAHECGRKVALHNSLCAMVESKPGPINAEVRLRLLEEAERYGMEQLGKIDLLLHHVRKISALLDLGLMDRIVSENEACREIASEIGQPHYMWYVETTDVMRSILQGDVAIPASLEVSYRAILKVTDDPNVIQGFAAQAFFCEVELGRQAKVLAPLRQILARFPLVLGWRAAEAWLHWTSGESAECSRVLDGVTPDRVSRLASQNGAGAALAMLCEVAACYGSRELRVQLWDLVAPMADKCATAGYGVLYFGAYSRYGGVLARSLGMHRESLDLLELAVRQESSRGAELWRGYALIDLALARAGASRKGRSSAESVMQDAERVVRAVRSTRLAQRFDRAQAQLRASV